MKEKIDKKFKFKGEITEIDPDCNIGGKTRMKSISKI